MHPKQVCLTNKTICCWVFYCMQGLPGSCIEHVTSQSIEAWHACSGEQACNVNRFAQSTISEATTQTWCHFFHFALASHNQLTIFNFFSDSVVVIAVKLFKRLDVLHDFLTPPFIAKGSPSDIFTMQLFTLIT